MPRRRQLRGRERALHHDLVHRDRRTEDPGPDVREVGELEETLHRAVLPVGTVQQREHDVDVERRARGGGRVIGDGSATSSPMPSAGAPSTANAAGNASPPDSIATRAVSASNQRPSVVIATGTISYRSGSSARATATAVARETSCSADRPP